VVRAGTPSSKTLTSYLHETPPAGRISTTNRFAFLDEATKMEIRRKTLKAVAIPWLPGAVWLP
jgi:hypothetical protein